MSDLDKHLATIDELLAGNTRPIFDENNPQARLPEPPESAVQYRPPSGTYDGAMDMKPRIDMSKFAMPILGQVDMNGDPVTRAKPKDAPGTPGSYAPVLGGRGMPVMMPSSPPDIDDGVASTPRTGGSRTTPRIVTADNPVTPGVAGTPAPQGEDMISLLRGLFQGAL